MMRKSENNSHFDFHVTALGMKEDDGYACVALEMDIWGFGDTPDLAFSDLAEGVAAQIAYAMEVHDFSLLDKPAPEEFQRLYKECLAGYITQNKDESLADKFVRCLPFPILPESNTYAFA